MRTAWNPKRTCQLADKGPGSAAKYRLLAAMLLFAGIKMAVRCREAVENLADLAGDVAVNIGIGQDFMTVAGHQSIMLMRQNHVDQLYCCVSKFLRRKGYMSILSS